MKISSVYIMICQSFDPRFYKPWGSHKWDPKQLELSYHISEKVTAAPLWDKMRFLFWNHYVITKLIFNLYGILSDAFSNSFRDSLSDPISDT